MDDDHICLKSLSQIIFHGLSHQIIEGSLCVTPVKNGRTDGKRKIELVATGYRSRYSAQFLLIR